LLFDEQCVKGWFEFTVWFLCIFMNKFREEEEKEEVGFFRQHSFLPDGLTKKNFRQLHSTRFEFARVLEYIVLE